jgi:tripartite-type tricarboxylate transporter receptor subunit TctC
LLQCETPALPSFAQSPYPNQAIRLVADFEASSWVGLLAPAKTPQAILNKLNAELIAVLNDPDVREKLNLMGITATPGSADKFGDEMKRDLARYGPVVKAAGIEAE